jgi:hypothetical protein
MCDFRKDNSCYWYLTDGTDAYCDKFLGTKDVGSGGDYLEWGGGIGILLL